MEPPDQRDEGAAAQDVARATWTRVMAACLAIIDDLPFSPAPAGEQAPAPATEAHSAWRATPTRTALDRARDRGWLVSPPAPATDRSGPLAGMTVAVKDIIDVAGLPVHNGTPGGRWRTPSTSAPAWSRLADLGARCIGKAATHEMAWGVTTPQIGNPHDPARLAGGSSGGSAATVAAGTAHAALGTDTGGSIRIPAALCGVVGLRPTVGSVPPDGVTPLSPTQDVVGPITPDLDTCIVVAEALLGRPLVLATPITSVLVPSSCGPLDATTSAAWQRAVRSLTDRGIHVLEMDLRPVLRVAGAVSVLTMLLESAVAHARAVDADPLAFGAETRVLLTLGRQLMDRADDIGAARAAITAETQRVFATSGADAVMTPTTACVAPLRNSPTVALDGHDVPVVTALTRFSGWAPATGCPAVSVPIPTKGMPAGIQLMGQPGHEATALAVCRLVTAPDSATC